MPSFLDQKVSFLLDSGCDYNLINGTFLDAILSRNQISLPTFRHSVRLNAHNNTRLSLRKDGILLPLTFPSSSGPQFMSLPFLIENSGSFGTVNIIGFTFMVHKRMVLDLSQVKLYISSTPEPHPSDTGDDLSIDSSFSLSVIPFKNLVDTNDSNYGKLLTTVNTSIAQFLRVPCCSPLGPVTFVIEFMRRKRDVYPLLTCYLGIVGQIIDFLEPL